MGQEITGNRFIIKTDKAGVKVSWQVTGIRHDAYADAHRIQVEEDKPLQEQGHYLHPELIGQPKPSATAYSREHRSDEGRESVAESVNTKWK